MANLTTTTMNKALQQEIKDYGKYKCPNGTSVGDNTAGWTGWLYHYLRELLRANEAGRNWFNNKMIYYCGREWSYADIFKGVVGGRKNYQDKLMGLQGFKSSFWTGNYRHMGSHKRWKRGLKEHYNYFQDKWEHNNGLTYMEWILLRARKHLFIHHLIWKFFNEIPERLTKYDKANKFIDEHYTLEERVKIWEDQDSYIKNSKYGFRYGFRESPIKDWKNIENFINSFGEGKEHDLEQIMGNKYYSKERVKRLWGKQYDWSDFTMKNLDDDEGRAINVV